MPDQAPGETSDKPWVTSGDYAPPHEDYLIGNRAGLQRLKEAIDQALINQECQIEESGIEFVGVRVVTDDPRGAKVRKHGVKDAVALVGCAVFLLFFGIVFFTGLVQIYNWLK